MRTSAILSNEIKSSISFLGSLKNYASLSLFLATSCLVDVLIDSIPLGTLYDGLNPLTFLDGAYVCQI